VVFLTVDGASISGNGDVALSGVKVNNHGPGFFTVTTLALTPAQTTGIPFDWVVFEPLPIWEEYGPTGVSGNVWTIAVDPRDHNVFYSGSSWGGVWKTVNGGQTWSPQWKQKSGKDIAQVGIYRIVVAPNNSNTPVISTVARGHGIAGGTMRISTSVSEKCATPPNRNHKNTRITPIRLKFGIMA